MIDYVLDACGRLPVTLVASPEVAAASFPRADLSVLVNATPERGMNYSLLIAHQAVPPEHALLVFLGDKPLVTTAIAQTVIDAALAHDADAAYPQRGGVGGHPVYFSPRARAQMGRLDHEPIRAIRDDPRLRRLAVPITEEGAYLDVDDPGTLLRLNE